MSGDLDLGTAAVRLVSAHGAALRSGAKPDAHPDAEMLARHVAGDLVQAEAREVVRHLAACSTGECLAYVRDEAASLEAARTALSGCAPAPLAAEGASASPVGDARGDAGGSMHARTFQCRDGLWAVFERMSADWGTPIDRLVNEAMSEYARQRSAIARMPFSADVSRSDQPERDPRRRAPASWRADGPTAKAQASAPALPAAPSMSVLPASPAPAARSPEAAPSPPAWPARPNRPPPPPPPPAGPMSQGPPPLAARPAPAAPSQVIAPVSTPINAPIGPSPAPAAPPRAVLGPATAWSARPLPAPPVPAPAPVSPPAASLSPPAAPPAPAPAAPKLCVWYAGQRYAIDKDRFVIGRGKSSCDLVVRDSNISRQHALVEQVLGQYFIVDMGSTNGIEHEGKRITRRVIADGDRFVMAGHEMIFSYS